MKLLGSTAIEDKLQENVGATLKAMRNAGIRTWVLTGDKVGTAKMIGHACELLQKEWKFLWVMEHESKPDPDTPGSIITNDDHVNTPDEVMASFLQQIADAELEKDENGNRVDKALLVEGNALLTLGIGLDNDGIAAKEMSGEWQDLKNKQKILIEKAAECRAVLCCRVSPSQKGQLTTLVRDILGKVTLGIGDGANDVSMITAAHVGIGVQGVEGSQAVNSADFAICQFQHLQNIVLVHGRWTYYRLSKAICYFFYKNIINVFTIMWYALITGFSGTLQYNDMVLCMYNLFFTSVPVMVFALLEQDVDYDTSLSHPTIYSPGQKKELLNFRVFFTWVGEAVYGATVIFFVPYIGMGHGSNLEEGINLNLEIVGLTMYTINVIAVTLRLALETQFFTWLHWVSYLGSIALWYLFLVVEFAVPTGIVTSGEMYWCSYNMWGTPYHWLTLALGTWLTCFPAFAHNCWRDCFLPTTNESCRRAMAAIHEEEAKAERVRAAAWKKLTPEEQRAQLLLASADPRNDMIGHDEINIEHARQGRISKMDDFKGAITMHLAAAKFMSGSAKRKQRLKALQAKQEDGSIARV